MLTEAEAAWSLSGSWQPLGGIQGSVVKFDGQMLHLDLGADDAVLRWNGNYDAALTLIRWGDWRFLVPSEELLDFCNDVNAGESLGEFHLTRCPQTALKDGIEPIYPSSDDPPEMPAQFQPFILKAPAEATLSKCHECCLPSGRRAAKLLALLPPVNLTAHSYRLSLQVRTPADVFAGMRLYARERFGMAHVVAVYGDEVDALYLELGPPNSHTPPDGRISFSTLAPPPLSFAKEDLRKMMRSFLRLEEPPSATSSTRSPAEIAKLRTFVPQEEWLLRELALELVR